MHQQLISFLKQRFDLPDSVYEHLQTKLHHHEFPKKHYLLKKGQIANRLWFVQRGLVRAYYEKNYNEVTSWFMQEGNFVLSVISFFEREPSHEYVQLLEDSLLTSITYDDLHETYALFPEFNLVGRILTQRYYVLSEKRLLNLRQQTVKERYLSFVNSQPGLFNRATVKDIASHLNMKPETLSRLRSKKL